MQGAAKEEKSEAPKEEKEEESSDLEGARDDEGQTAEAMIGLDRCGHSRSDVVHTLIITTNNTSYACLLRLI